MITVNTSGGGTLPSAAAEKAQAIEPVVLAQSADLAASAPVAAYLSLPGFRLPSAASAADPRDSTVAEVGSMALPAGRGTDALSAQALTAFDDGLKSLAQRPETQVFQARFGAETPADDSVLAPAPLPGVDEDGLVRLPGADSLAADTDHDGKISEDELRRYQEPLTYRRTESMDRLAALADGPSAFSLVEANRAYGVVSAAAATA